ncbi:hypothetical protein CQA49_00035 [Helicobacter sp. MIT 00-7814]|uniref:DNA-methyltransferase n=1 Tax=unclassified Helicobacter TaxID=2593540 RepID=UPI000E1EC7D8|nr:MULTISPECIES: site-specific DNA-methyltransferase [unclassified Helicobacter]RDU57093.1 hypothetical protein CQA49_00035 [Helicobacter sp. MIT 00-7814]RDU57644.1 hypothetical protein CQA37_00035 [Helicobacter sp. MIT 99-10781]
MTPKIAKQITQEVLKEIQSEQKIIFVPREVSLESEPMSQPTQSQSIQNLLGLHHYEALEFAKTIPNDSIDLIITDPPYDFSDSNTRGGKLVTKKPYWKNITSKAKNLTFGFDFALLDEFERIQKSRNLYIFCNARLLQRLLSYYQNLGVYHIDVLIYHKTNPLPAFKYHYLQDLEYILFVCDDKSSMNNTFETSSKLYSDKILSKAERYTTHPTEKPLKLIENLILNSSKQGQIIYDPFSGGGTTAHACKSLNRRFIGTEIDWDFIKQSEQRLANKVSASLFV